MENIVLYMTIQAGMLFLAAVWAVMLMPVAVIRISLRRKKWF